MRFSRTEDHPRRCGENYGNDRFGSELTGSPPQVRGKLNSVRRYARFVGITPAGAGKTPRSQGWASQTKDHPRRCGENCFVTLGFAKMPGITPAGAGKTTICTFAPAIKRDHPRRCGENTKKIL